MNKPFDPRDNYVMAHNSFLTLYTRLPDFKADAIALWMYLSMRYNANEGYAYPDTWDIAIALNISESKVTMLKKILIKYGLIDVERHPTFNNDVYVPKAPITDETLFYEMYPEAVSYYESRKSKAYERRQSGRLRKKAHDDRVKNLKRMRESGQRVKGEDGSIVVYKTDNGDEIPIDELF